MVRLVLITDRRLCGGTALLRRIREILVAAPRGHVAIQVRERDLDGGALLEITQMIVEVARPFGAEVWVNDRVDVALAAGAEGVHLPESGLSVTDARAIISGSNKPLRIGCSRHAAAGVLEAAREGAERIHIGPIWATPGKQAMGLPAIGLSALAIRHQLPAHVQLVAVGGIDSPDRVSAARGAGADAVAVIRAAWKGEMVSDTISSAFSGSSAAS